MDERRKTELCERMAAMLPVLRKAMHVTQIRLAELAGVNRSTVIHMERSKTMGWSTYLALLMIFSRQECTETLLRAYGLFPEELSDYLAGRTAAEA